MSKVSTIERQLIEKIDDLSKRLDIHLCSTKNSEWEALIGNLKELLRRVDAIAELISPDDSYRGKCDIHRSLLSKMSVTFSRIWDGNSYDFPFRTINSAIDVAIYYSGRIKAPNIGVNNFDAAISALYDLSTHAIRKYLADNQLTFLDI